MVQAVVIRPGPQVQQRGAPCRGQHLDTSRGLMLQDT